MTATMFRHQASGTDLCREIAQPHVTTFAECFDAWKPYTLDGTPMPPHPFQPRYVVGQNVASNLYNDVTDIMRGKPQKWHADETMPVGPFCTFQAMDFNQSRYFSVSCADWVLSRIKERTIVIGGDRISFEIIDHGEGWSLVIAQHSQITGSVWLAYIRTDSIPS